MDTDVFNVYVERVLGPTIRRGDILVLDDPRAHHASRIGEVAAQCGAEVIWPAPYSPDFPPIELMWSKIKASLRAAEARTREELERALVAALELVTSNDCAGWFKYCGYQVAHNRNQLYMRRNLTTACTRPATARLLSSILWAGG